MCPLRKSEELKSIQTGQFDAHSSPTGQCTKEMGELFTAGQKINEIVGGGESAS